MSAHFINKRFSEIVFGGFLILTTATILSIYKPKYAHLYGFANVKRL